MRESRYDLLCAVLLGIGQLCMFTGNYYFQIDKKVYRTLLTGYDTQLTIVEPVLHSVHDRSPTTIDSHAGYYGYFCSRSFAWNTLQWTEIEKKSIKYVLQIIILITHFHLCKSSRSLGSWHSWIQSDSPTRKLITITLYIINPECATAWVYDVLTTHSDVLLHSLDSILCDLCYAGMRLRLCGSNESAANWIRTWHPPLFSVFYTGHGGYTTEHSTKTTIERNSAITWALATSWCANVKQLKLVNISRSVWQLAESSCYSPYSLQMNLLTMQDGPMWQMSCAVTASIQKTRFGMNKSPIPQPYFDELYLLDWCMELFYS